MDIESELETQKEGNQQKENLVKELEKLSSNEEKVKAVLEAMKSAISQKGSPSFKNFWESSHLCLELFKGSLNPIARSQFWGEYVELTQEAKRLKEILEEQANFALEQIDLAIKGVESDLVNYNNLLEKMPVVDFPYSRELAPKIEYYAKVQRELAFLSALGNRVASLRKEVLKVELRMKDKSKFLKMLSHLGDTIFPKRKELLKKIGDEFTQDVENFVLKYFKGPKIKGAPYYVLKDEIRKWQTTAKLLNLGVEAYTNTRLKLSECWEKVVVEEKELKQEEEKQKETFKGNREKIEAKIKEFAEKCGSGAIEEDEANKQFEEISRQMRGTQLSRFDVKKLKDELFAAKELIFAKKKKEIEEKRLRDKAFLDQRVSKIENLKVQICDIIKIGKEISLEELLVKEKELLKIIEELSLASVEKGGLEKFLYEFKKLIMDKKELKDKEAIKSADEAELLKFLTSYQEQRQVLKVQIDEWRKILASSDVDIEKAMMYREFIDDAKVRVEKLERQIEEIEESI